MGLVHVQYVQCASSVIYRLEIQNRDGYNYGKTQNSPKIISPQNGGEARIRTRDTVSGIPVFESKLVGHM